MDLIYDAVKKAYLETGSIRQTGIRCELSRVKVRKLLAEMGLYESSLSNRIKDLMEQGRSKEGICQELGISMSTLNAHLPYRKGLYLGEVRSKQALRSERFHVKEALHQRMAENLRKEKRR